MRHNKIIALLLFLFFFGVGIATRSPLMVTWDEPENYYVGRVYLNQLMGSSLPQALPFRADDHWERYPPFAVTIASFTSWVLAETLHLTTSVDAHHIAVIGFGAVGAVATYAIALELGLSLPGALVSALVLFFSPIYFGHLHTNPKDIPGAAMFTLAIALGLRKMNVLSGIFFGFAMATKFNTVFVLPILLVYFFIKKKPIHLFWYAIGALGALAICWPWLVTDPVEHIGQIIQYIGEVGRGLNVLAFGHLYRAGIDVPWWYAPILVIIQTPPVILCLVFFGIFFSKKRLLPCIWFVVVCARYLDPHTIIYNGARHVMEVFPAIALLVGIGVDRVPRLLRVPIMGIIFITLLLPILSLHPYEAMNFNQLVGGPKKASTTFDFDYWGFSVGELVDQVNEIEKDTNKKVYILWLGFPAAYFPNNRLLFVTTEAEQADYVIVPNSRNFFDGAIHYWLERGTVVATVKRDGITLGYLFATHK